MIATDEDALMCDLAETYHIYDYRQLTVLTAAAFSVGLRDDSRIKMILSGQKVSFDRVLQASIADRLGILIWQKTKDGQANRNRPQSFVELLTAEPKEREEIAFESGKDFEEYRRQLLGKGGDD